MHGTTNVKIIRTVTQIKPKHPQKSRIDVSQLPICVVIYRIYNMNNLCNKISKIAYIGFYKKTEKMYVWINEAEKY